MGNSNLRVVTSAPVGTPTARTLLAGVVCGADISIHTIIYYLGLCVVENQCHAMFREAGYSLFGNRLAVLFLSRGIDSPWRIIFAEASSYTVMKHARSACVYLQQQSTLLSSSLHLWTI